MSDLATCTATAQLSGQPGRALLAARGNHLAVDSTPPLGGPNEAVNPLDLLLGALATCGVFLCETAAREQGVTLTDARATVEADFDPRGINDDDVDPHVQQYRVQVEVSGPSEEEGRRLEEAFRSRCPIFTTLVKSAPIELSLSVS